MQHVYSVSTTTNVTKCLTCNVTSLNTNTACLYNTAVFSGDSSYYVLNCEGPGVPETSLYSIDDGKIEIWEDNEEMVELIQEKLVPSSQRFNFSVADGFTAQVYLRLPPNLDTSGNTKYPMLVNV